MSIGLAVALVALTTFGVTLLLLPLLLRQGRPASRDAYNLAVYRDQLAEVERDVGRGLMNAEQAETARAEIGRRILALGPPDAGGGEGGRRIAAATAAILLLPVAALLLYAQLGSPGVPDEPFAERGAAGAPTAAAAADNTPHVDMKQAIARLEAHLKAQPDDLTGWILLARSKLSLEEYPQAVEAYRHAADLSGHRADIVGDWGEAQVMAAGGTVTPAAREAFEAGLKDAETAPRSRYYLALAKMQQGDTKGALQRWVDLEADSPADADWLPIVRQRIAEAAAKIHVDPATLKTSAGASRPAATAAAAAAPPAAQPEPAGMPSQETVAAAAQATAGASAEERLAMINTMVERLAARLEKQPNDVEGWTRLGRSYMVLNRPDKARDAYARALQLKPDDAALRQGLAEATAAAKPSGNPARTLDPEGGVDGRAKPAQARP